ncbi:Homeobox 10 [Gossypium australe]|uniref:Homeobox 10 n=1 Tax=Gossypium australe TaxID=47621 RepID=A0A5B6UNI5_9ROSI|nr:Homeobox 10 [Gossypium australe]
MGDSGQVQIEEDKVSLDVNKKRAVKTPAQVIVLENFYKEERFPSDEMKAKLAVQLGLTQKQISSWFCHRRLKDKRRDDYYANGQHDYSSGVIQDHVSRLRQDSCGSIKQGDYRYIDLREVESRIIHGQGFPAADLTYERRSHQYPYGVQMEDPSSESSLSLHDQLFLKSGNPYDMHISAKPTQNGAIVQTNSSSKSIGYKPSGYLKVKGESENPVITAVKRQMGRHYREDGPVLGIQFDPLPPGAFEFPSSHPVNEPINIRDSQQPHCLDISGVMKQSKPKFINEVHNTMLSFQDSYMEGANFNTLHGSKRQDWRCHHQPKYKPSFSCSNPFSDKDFPLDIYKGYDDKPAISDCKRSWMSSKLVVERMVPDSCSNHPGPYGRKFTNEEKIPGLHDARHIHMDPKAKNLPKTSSFIRACSESLGNERGPFARMEKVENAGGEWKLRKDYPVRVKIDATNELRVAKRVDLEFPQKDFVANASHARLRLLTNQSKGLSMDVLSSFSGDETAETSLSSRIEDAYG